MRGWSGGLPGCLGVVKRPSRVVERPSRMSESGREPLTDGLAAFTVVREWLGALSDV